MGDFLELRLDESSSVESLDEAKKKKGKRNVKVVSTPTKGKQCIVRLGNGKYRLVSKNGKNMGTFDTAEEADKARVAQFAYLSARGKGKHNPGKKYGDKNWDKKHGESLELRLDDNELLEEIEPQEEGFLELGPKFSKHGIGKKLWVTVKKGDTVLIDDVEYSVVDRQKVSDTNGVETGEIIYKVSNGSKDMYVLPDIQKDVAKVREKIRK